MRKRTLTKRQEDILDFIGSYTQENKYPPTVREIGRAVGLSSPSSVQTQLTKLANLGYITRDSSKSRSMVVTNRARRERQGEAASTTSPAVAAPTPARTSSTLVPLVGRVAAGMPILAEENIEDEVPVPTALFGDAGSFLLTVHGESMVDAGIYDGDVLLVKEQSCADDGQIVIALLGEEATVKRYFREKDCIRLQPENEAMEPIYTRDAQVLGVVTGLFRSL